MSASPDNARPLAPGSCRPRRRRQRVRVNRESRERPCWLASGPANILNRTFRFPLDKPGWPAAGKTLPPHAFDARVAGRIPSDRKTRSRANPMLARFDWPDQPLNVTNGQPRDGLQDNWNKNRGGRQWKRKDEVRTPQGVQGRVAGMICRRGRDVSSGGIDVRKISLILGMTLFCSGCASVPSPVFSSVVSQAVPNDPRCHDYSALATIDNQRQKIVGKTPVCGTTWVRGGTA